MELMWWPIALIGLICLALAVAFAVLMPTERNRRQLRPLANTWRLTRLPEYRRVARSRTLATATVLAVLAALVATAVLAGARPTGWKWSAGNETPEDIMLCVGEPVTDADTGEFLSYFARQVTAYGTQRVGLTSVNRRVIPLTRDYQYAAGKIAEYARLAQLQSDVDADRPVPAPQVAAMREKAATFAPAVSYTDYTPSVDDVIALCITGFPEFDKKSERRRSVIYLGPGVIRDPDETRTALFSDQRVAEMAHQAGVQINAITTSPRGTEATLRSLTEATDGRFFFAGRDDSALGTQLDVIKDNPPKAGLPGGGGVVGWTADSPELPLIAGLVLSILLCLSLAVLGR
jgi:hypothetical protein